MGFAHGYSEAIEKLAQEFDISNMTEKESVRLFAKLTDYGALSYEEFLAVLPTSDNINAPMKSSDFYKQMSSGLNQLAKKMEFGEKVYTTGVSITPSEIREQAAIYDKVSEMLSSLSSSNSGALLRK